MTSTLKSEAASSAAKGFVNFVNQAVTPFHAVATVTSMLTAAGFQQLDEGKVWPELARGGKYFVTRNETSIVAFAVGGRFEPANGVKIVGAHTDSPNFALKPKTKSEGAKYNRVGVQCYGGGLWHTWFDRDLTVAGRVVVSENGKMCSKLVHIAKPILRIPTLAIHLQSAAEREGFAPNKENHLVPIIATQFAENEEHPESAEASGHCVALMREIAAEAGCKPEDIIDYDLSLIDTQPSAIGGAHSEFIFSPRVDNLVSCYCAIEALVNAGNLEEDTMTRMVCLFDHEEVGSSSPQGAGGTLIPDIIEHLIHNKTLRATLVANSFLLSVDGAHACHPNYPEKHESQHRPELHRGPVIKYNANVRYATNGVTGAIVKDLAKRASVPIQEFVVKNDSPCGSTIGPILSTLSGIRTADIGNAMLSMHSVREMCGTVDVLYMTQLIDSFFVNYAS